MFLLCHAYRGQCCPHAIGKNESNSCPPYGIRSFLTPQTLNSKRPIYITRVLLCQSTSHPGQEAHTLYKHIITVGRSVGLYHQFGDTLAPGVTHCTTNVVIYGQCKYFIFHRSEQAMFLVMEKCC